ncbi:MAG: hypothetical protein LJE95_03150 [Acidobacteria bacterium]|nr:hypothetical protein [Acidobacteriota bacterium]
MELEGQISFLEAELQRLILEWERYFAGDRRVPPQIERQQFAHRLRVLAERGAGTHALRFRLQQLQHKFSTYYALWERQLREREEGRTAGGSGPYRRVPDTPEPVSVNGDEALYERYVRAKRRLGQDVGLDRATFVQRLEGQRRRLQNGSGRSVQFDVVVEGDKVKLAARGATRNGNGE